MEAFSAGGAEFLGVVFDDFYDGVKRFVVQGIDVFFALVFYEDEVAVE